MEDRPVARTLRLLVGAIAMFLATSAQGQIINESLSGSSAVQPGATHAAEQEPAASGPFSWMVPKVTLPKISMPKIEMPKMPTNAFAPVKASAQKVKDGARKAWEGTKEILTFGRGSGEPSARVASRQQPSMMQRMFGSGESTESQPQTMAEFISQPRPE